MSDSIPEFESFLNFDEFIPHYCLIKSEYNKYYFIYSALNCLTNIKSFLIYLYKYNDINEPSKYYSILYKTIYTIVEKIKDKENNKINFEPKELIEFILKKIELFKKKSNQDPRILIDFIYTSFLVDEKNVPTLFVTNDLSYASLNVSEMNNLDLEGINAIIKRSAKCQNIKCRNNSEVVKSFSTLHFSLKPDKEYTIYDCFNDFLKNENEKEYTCKKCSCISKTDSKYKFHRLPEDIIIFIYYDGETKDYEDFYYKFDETLDFTNCDFISRNIKFKKYLLSSLIACKCPKTEDEIFYTFCRKDSKDSKDSFLIYFSGDKNVRDGKKNVKNKLSKLKTDQYERKRSYPYVLVYNAVSN